MNQHGPLAEGQSARKACADLLNAPELIEGQPAHHGADPTTYTAPFTVQ